jgi:hypothetical protein
LIQELLKVPVNWHSKAWSMAAWNLPCANHAKSFLSLEENAKTPKFGPN